MPISSFRWIEREEGAALVEVLIALAVFGLVAAVVGLSLPRLRQTPGAGEAISRIEAFILEAGYQARLRQAPVKVVYDGKRFLREPSDGPGLDLTFFPGEISVISAAELSDRGRGAIIFMPDGSSSGARLELREADRIRVLDIGWSNSAVTWHAR
ncbi:MAG: hypothetical protein O9322_05600 [Beijerinckiaceae bacterium]|nr:hypothetical protein [Beijerinckiaceae bacterium]MCZ8298996.1 hypothetical protein [Beijerinckiaceae bacterium]